MLIFLENDAYTNGLSFDGLQTLNFSNCVSSLMEKLGLLFGVQNFNWLHFNSLFCNFPTGSSSFSKLNLRRKTLLEYNKTPKVDSSEETLTIQE